ncbi:MAG: hypothetical protein F6J97_05050, partial [Leptolyngbya sp. SIO4C1]|nr:hypothetical protein [Leptolyngbya sp. SIO4C1]
LEQYPEFHSDLLRQDLVPGLIVYDNPAHYEDIMNALRTLIDDYYETIRADRLATYGAEYSVTTQPPVLAQVGRLPGLVYGFTGTRDTGEVAERYISYIMFDSAQYLYIITTSYDPLAESGTFTDLASLEQFAPHLATIVDNLDLPHRDW